MQRSHNDFNPRAPYGARLLVLSCHGLDVPISIHAPHTGRDRCWSVNGMTITHISIHAPHTGRDLGPCRLWQKFNIFQSTRPIRGATPHGGGMCRLLANFNPRAPYGARQLVRVMPTFAPQISIHAPHTGRDGGTHYQLCLNLLFQSTRPIRGATVFPSLVVKDFIYFNPRAPYGARLCFRSYVHRFRDISIHAPHTGRDSASSLASGALDRFQSTRPIRGATA